MDGDAPRTPRWVGVPRSAPLESHTRATWAHMRVGALVARHPPVAAVGPVSATGRSISVVPQTTGLRQKLPCFRACGAPCVPRV